MWNLKKQINKTVTFLKTHRKKDRTEELLDTDGGGRENQRKVFTKGTNFQLSDR